MAGKFLSNVNKSNGTYTATVNSDEVVIIGTGNDLVLDRSS